MCTKVKESYILRFYVIFICQMWIKYLIVAKFLFEKFVEKVKKVKFNQKIFRTL